MQRLSILGSGMVSPVGLSAATTCAAIRCALDNFKETRFIDVDGEWLLGAGVELEHPWRGREKLVRMATRAILEALQAAPGVDPGEVPLLLCVAEPQRPGRLDGLDTRLLRDVERVLGVQFHTSSAVVSRGRVAGAVALLNARQLIAAGGHRHVLIAGVDSLLEGATLTAYEARGRLLSSRNSNGFIPGEAAAAVLLGATFAAEQAQLLCTGLGFGVEPAAVEVDDTPLRAEGLSKAIRTALADADCSAEHLDLRLTDLTGEQYYFREAALALARVLRGGGRQPDLHHPGDCIGETGAAIGCVLMAQAFAWHTRRQGATPSFLLHVGNDTGERAAIILRVQHVRAP